MLGEMCTKPHSSTLKCLAIQIPINKNWKWRKTQNLQKWETVRYFNYNFTLAQPDVRQNFMQKNVSLAFYTVVENNYERQLYLINKTSKEAFSSNNDAGSTYPTFLPISILESTRKRKRKDSRQLASSKMKHYCYI